MALPLLAVVAGLLAGWATRRQRRELHRGPLRLWWLLPAGLVVEAVPAWADVPLSPAWVLLAHTSLVAFATANVRQVGMAVVAVGLALNLGVIAVNGGMPVSGPGLVAAGLAQPSELAALDLGPKRRLAQPGDHLTALGDVIPVRPLGLVVSAGDLIVAAGLANVAVHLWPGSPRKRSPLGGFRRDGLRSALRPPTGEAGPAATPPGSGAPRTPTTRQTPPSFRGL